jgi:hypothetical protein
VTNGEILWLALLVVLAGLAAMVVRRMTRLINRTRSLESFQRSARQLDDRIGAAADPLVARLDELRRHAGDPQGVAEALSPVAAALELAVSEARGLRPPAPLQRYADAMVLELERAIRAIEMIDHGLGALVTVRGNRELEAQTSLKRGALNLRHARAAVREVVNQVSAIRPADLAEPASGRATTRGPSVPTYIVDTGDQDLEGRFDPRM